MRLRNEHRFGYWESFFFNACGSDVVWEVTDNTESGQIVRCNGPPLLCRPRAITSLAHAYSRDALDVTGLSESRIQQLMEADTSASLTSFARSKQLRWKRAKSKRKRRTTANQPNN